MALETVEFVNTLNPANPGPNDQTSQGDDHIRNIKKALKATFPNITKAITKTADQINKLVETTRKVSTGDGLSGGGDFTADRTIAVDSTVARRSQRINTNAGSGLTGGGPFASNLSLAVDPDQVAMNPSTVVRNTRKVDTGDGLEGGGDLSGNRTLKVGPSVVRTSRELTAGDGLSGGGTLGADRSFRVDNTVFRTNSTVKSENVNSTGSAPVYCVRAWGSFSGNGMANRGGNFKSVERLGTGRFRVTFDTPMPHNVYSITGGTDYKQTVTMKDLATNSFVLEFRTTTGGESLEDPDRGHFQVVC